MASSLPPNLNPNQPALGGSGDDKGPLTSLNLNFLKSLNDKKTTRDGNTPKRRGPKPDSKPAMTRRQELNRQAQRTHRERKELYIKALEDEVLRLKEIYSNVSQAKERLAEENRQLKSMMAQNGVPLGPLPGSSMLDDSIGSPSLGYTSGGSVSGSAPPPPSSHTSAFTPPPMSVAGGGGSRGMSPRHTGHQHQHSGTGSGAGAGAAGPVAPGQAGKVPGVDYEQAGIDFVLTLEKPCMDHMPWLLERGVEVGGHEPCGHALMASCPPEPFTELTSEIPFGYKNVSSTGHGSATDSGQRTWELTKGDLATLLDLSKRLNLDGEITPVMAWGMVLGHPRLSELRPDDFGRLSEELGNKIRCYGFGAVLEEFEVRDALETVISAKDVMVM